MTLTGKHALVTGGVTGIDAPETRTKDQEEKRRGIQAKDWLDGMLDVDPEKIRLVSDEFASRGKFGRILGTFLIQYDADQWINVNQQAIAEELVKPYFGGAR